MAAIGIFIVLGVLAIFAILVTMLFDDSGRPQVLWSVAVAAVILVTAFIRHGRSRAADPVAPDPVTAAKR